MWIHTVVFLIKSWDTVGNEKFLVRSGTVLRSYWGIRDIRKGIVVDLRRLRLREPPQVGHEVRLMVPAFCGYVYSGYIRSSVFCRQVFTSKNWAQRFEEVSNVRVKFLRFSYGCRTCSSHATDCVHVFRFSALIKWKKTKKTLRWKPSLHFMSFKRCVIIHRKHFQWKWMNEWMNWCVWAWCIGFTWSLSEQHTNAFRIQLRMPRVIEG